MFPQPPPLVCVFFWDRWLLLLVGGNFAIVEAMDESEGVPDGQQTDLVAKVVPESIFEHNLRRKKLSKGYLDTLEPV